MIDPLRDRLAEIMADAWPLTDMPPWEGATEPERDSWREVADAILASEEWQAREAVVEAAKALPFAEALAQIADDCEKTAQDPICSVGESRAWRAVANIARAAFSRDGVRRGRGDGEG